jgi:hypothetical protein
MALRLQSSRPMRLAVVLVVLVTGCATTRATTTTTVEEDEPAMTTSSSTMKAARAESTLTMEAMEATRACATVASREACVTCCDFSNAAKDDVDACVLGASCESKPPKHRDNADCRTTGCGEGLQCEACWTRWVCVGNGVHC